MAAALAPEGADEVAEREGVVDAIAEAVGCVDGGGTAGVVDDALKEAVRGVAGVLPGFRNDEKPLIFDCSSWLFARTMEEFVISRMLTPVPSSRPVIFEILLDASHGPEISPL